MWEYCNKGIHSVYFWIVQGKYRNTLELNSDLVIVFDFTLPVRLQAQDTLASSSTPQSLLVVSITIPSVQQPDVTNVPGGD